MTTAVEFFETSKKGAELTITKYTGQDTVVMIPEKIDGSTVTKIGEYAFGDCDKLKEIDIPDGVIIIESAAFHHCTNLTKITIPKSVLSIRSSAFYNCTNLVQINIPENISKLEHGIFGNCTMLNQISIPKKLTEIGDGAFQNCTSLSQIVLPETIIRVGWNAFAGCTNLEKIAIPHKIRSIEMDAFWGCTRLAGNRDFAIVNETLFAYYGSDEVITIPDGVTLIGFNAFKNCSTLKQVEIPIEVSKIGSSAFEGCINLRKLVVENPKCKISRHAFDNTPSLVNLVNISPVALNSFPTVKLMFVINQTFSKWESLSDTEKITVFNYTKNKKDIKKELFKMGCSSVIVFFLGVNKKWPLAEINEYIGISISKEYTHITAMLLEYKNNNYSKNDQETYLENEELVEIGVEAPTFKQLQTKWRCGNVPGGICITGYRGSLTKEVIPAQIQNGKQVICIGWSKFASFNTLSEILLPDEVTTIEKHTFRNCNNLTQIVIPKKVSTIEKDTFQGCSNLRRILLPEGLKSIGQYAFQGCSSINKIIIPNSVTTIKAGAFSGCTSLAEVTLPKSVKIGKDAFENCPFQPPKN